MSNARFEVPTPPKLCKKAYLSKKLGYNDSFAMSCDQSEHYCYVLNCYQWLLFQLGLFCTCAVPVLFCSKISEQDRNRFKFLEQEQNRPSWNRGCFRAPKLVVPGP
uniref:Uncharacterized protein n=1 Tax=Globodera rostochiensis TaxID=31243 RepID=A0A914HAX8_GLORO